MSSAPRVRAIEVRHVQLGRAVIAAAAALMITFSPDHSEQVGLSVFSGFAVVTALVLFLTVRSVHPAGARWPWVTVGVLSVIAGLVASAGSFRSTTMFFVLVIAWAALTGVVEVIAGARMLRLGSLAQRPGLAPWGAPQAHVPVAGSGDVPASGEFPPNHPDLAASPDLGTSPRGAARDTLTVGILSLVLAAALILVPSGFALQYYIEDAGRSFTLTGTTIGVGIFGAYAAILAVYLAIAAFSPRAQPVADPASASHERGAV